MSENGNGRRRDAQGKFLPANDADTQEQQPGAADAAAQEQQPEQPAGAADAAAQEQQPEQPAGAADAAAQEQQPEQPAGAADAAAQEQQPEQPAGAADAAAQEQQPEQPAGAADAAAQEQQPEQPAGAADAAAQEQQPGLFSRFGSSVATVFGKVWTGVSNAAKKVWTGISNAAKKVWRGAVRGTRHVFGQWPRASWATTGAVLVLVGVFTYQQRDDVADFAGGAVPFMAMPWSGTAENLCDQYAGDPVNVHPVLDLSRGGVRVYPAATWCAYNASLAYNLEVVSSVADSIVIDGEDITVRDCLSNLPAQTDGKNVYSRACTALLRGGPSVVMVSDLQRLVL